VEEFWMLEYTFAELSWAKNQGLITKKGWELIQPQRKEVTAVKNKIKEWEKKIPIYRLELKTLKQVLSQAKKDYAK
jgi:hypothetical protein